MQSLFLSDEEMGKKDDDHKPAKVARRGSVWTPARIPPRRFAKRLLLLALVGAAVYVFITNMPTDLGIRDRRRPTYIYPDDDLEFPQATPLSKQKPRPPLVPPFRADGGRDRDDKTREPEPEPSYSGPVRFLELAPSLHVIASTKGGFATNKNVLFAASSLKSAATLLPMACQMGSELRSYVHFALMSRSDIELEELRQINGIDDSCQIIFHDARPDYAAISTDTRLGTGVSRALYHIHLYMHPQVMIVDGSSSEEAFFTEAVWKQSRDLQIPLIEIPHNGAKKLGYLAKLDSASLSVWSKLSIDILVHVPPHASGSLIRLLKSLGSADFTASSVPHLTVDLPQQIDGPTADLLRDFQWPPSHTPNPPSVRQLSLWHRISGHGVNEEESSVRFLESFWPAHPGHSHVLVLSPQVELSQDFFHYLKYAILEYRYSNMALLQEWDQKLFGISLELPSMSLNASSFSPPARLQQPGEAKQASGGPTSFLWQAPNSNAVLFLGERWVELHGFVAKLLEARNKLPQPPKLLGQKLVSKAFPSWLEHALRLCRARGYWTLYPSQPTSSFVASVHRELYLPPEEYENEVPRSKGVGDAEVSLASGSFLSTLPNQGGLPSFKEIPLLAWDGAATDLEGLNKAATEYAMEFRRQVGECDGSSLEGAAADPSAKDLFCEDDEQPET